jgi:XRE family transcriptional regulator of biofilm formation
MPLGRRLYRKRLERGLTQTDLARQVRVPQSFISRLEAGIKDYPSVEVLKRLARVLGCTTDYLVGMDVEEELLPAVAS